MTRLLKGRRSPHDLNQVDSGPGEFLGTPQSLSITDNDNASITISALSDVRRRQWDVLNRIRCDGHTRLYHHLQHYRFCHGSDYTDTMAAILIF